MHSTHRRRSAPYPAVDDRRRPCRARVPAAVPSRRSTSRPVVSLHDFEAPARERLHPAAWAYYAGRRVGRRDAPRQRRRRGTGWRLRPRVLRDVSTDHSPPRSSAGPCRDAAGDRARGAPRPGPPRRRAGDRARGRRRRGDHGRVDGGLALDRDRRGGGARCATLVPALRTSTTRGISRSARGAGGRGRVRGPRADRGHCRCSAIATTCSGCRSIPARMPTPTCPSATAWRQGQELDEMLDMRGVPLTWDSLDEIRSWAPLPLVLKGILTAGGRADRGRPRRRRSLGQQPRRPPARPVTGAGRRARRDRGRRRGPRPRSTSTAGSAAVRTC